jgi:hypothetical protein
MVSDSESYAGGSIATDRASHSRQVKSDDPDKKGYPGLPGWGVGGGGHKADNHTPLQMCTVEKLPELEKAKVHQGL